MNSLRDSFRRLREADPQSRPAKTVEVFGWLILIEGGVILLAPHVVVSLLHLPPLGNQGEHYFRLLGLLVGGVGMLYVVSGRMNAEGFVFASLLDRPLVPFAMALLWRFDIVPGPLALAFAIQDFGSFLWTLTTWLGERRTAAATRPRESALSSSSIRAFAAIYAAAMFEELKMFRVVDRLAELFQTGMLPLGQGEGGTKLSQYAAGAAHRLTESERRSIYQRALGVDGGGDSNRDFDGLWLRFLSAVAAAGRSKGASQGGLRTAGRDLAVNVSLHGSGPAAAAATALQAQVKDMTDILSKGSIQSAYGARDMWQLIDEFASRELGGASNGARLRALQASGAAVLEWLAARAGDLSQESAGPLLNPGDIERCVTRGPDAPSAPTDYDLVQAAERWLEASA